MRLVSLNILCMNIRIYCLFHCCCMRMKSLRLSLTLLILSCILQSCSSKRMHLLISDPSMFSLSSMNSEDSDKVSSKKKDNDKLERVCDGCFNRLNFEVGKLYGYRYGYGLLFLVVDAMLFYTRNGLDISCNH